MTRRVAITVNNSAHNKSHAAWMKTGLERHGWTVLLAPRGTVLGASLDMVCCWGVKQPVVWEWRKKFGKPVLVMERGHLPPRFEWTSCGFNGLAGKAVYAKANDGGERWRTHFGHLEKPWTDGRGYALVCGQVLGDAALWGCNFRHWAQKVTDELKAKGQKVIYRAHPFALEKQKDRWCPKGALFSTRPYAADLADASLVVTYNSTAGVEAVLAGVPTVAFNAGSMAWPVTTHDLQSEPIRPERSAWAHDLAWSSWRPEEIASGETWARLESVMPNG